MIFQEDLLMKILTVLLFMMMVPKRSSINGLAINKTHLFGLIIELQRSNK